MKLTTTIGLLGLAATTSHAAVLARAESTTPTAYCSTPGQPCDLVARAAAAFAGVLRAVDNNAAALSARDTQRTNSPGGAVFAAKRAADGLALTLAASGAHDPRAYYAGLGLERRFPPDHDPSSPAAADEGTTTDDDMARCLVAGAPCRAAKRAAEAVLQALDADDEPAARVKRAPAPWCHFRGGFCRRDDAPHPFDPAARVRRDPTPWCHFRGGFCRRDEAETARRQAECYAPDGECVARARDVLAIQAAARQVVDMFPEGR
ncbi:hypothetical protein P8C59_006967 [Phyllachora maydis]|uniref:Clock-controlled pheromone ccg-4 n=1 Tax=Phyllachora maydis TaxID=1825666 RepID=A0AAD9I7R7_9PEZI|nr:hypothetical protein P8C59_006967 [Phyllachora maydis]